jgi:hypothetical protein
MTNKKRIYIAGPMTSIKLLNFPAFFAAEAHLEPYGYQVVNPARINPDHTMAWSECMRRDISELVTCSAIYMLPGWQNSKGATLENHIAERLGLDIIFAPTYPAGGRKIAHAVLAGRGRLGVRCGRGTVVHAVEYFDERKLASGLLAHKAVCGQKQGGHTAGWVHTPEAQVMCPVCVRRLNKAVAV